MATTPPGPPPEGAYDRVHGAISVLHGDLARSDSKAGLLLALTGAALAALVSAAASLDLSVVAAVAGTLSAAALLTATAILLIAVRPDLGGTGWTSWPELSKEQLRDRLATGHLLEHAQQMAALATRKFRRIRTAVDCMLVGLALLALTSLLAVTT
ncbi:Pycsar system effector family protein [Streptomyces specialis]|uniref:Pycsar system effector family protein n=1 Tax=Streptomyces specialis TaxID=498367 RepID=UPI00073FA54B|nr:Pycsar system effector family protein [Streptomyces specialis]